MSLKIKPAKTETTSKVTFKLPESTVELLNKYREACKAEYGTEPNLDYIANEIFMSFFNSDKKFQQFIKAQKGAKTENSAPATA